MAGKWDLFVMSLPSTGVPLMLKHRHPGSARSSIYRAAKRLGEVVRVKKLADGVEASFVARVPSRSGVRFPGAVS